MGMTKVSIRWVPKLLRVAKKNERMDFCKKFLELCNEDKEKILQQIVTGDETMVLHDDPLSKKDSMKWRKKGESAPKKAKVTQSVKKIMATIFWDCEGILLIDFKKCNKTVNAAYYADLLRQL